jgi:uncharacterized RDD family membrane protein YckC
MMPATLNFRAVVPMVGVMNAIAQASPVTGPKLDNRRVLAGIVDLLIVAAGAAVVLVAGDALTGDRQSTLGAVILGWALYYFFALESGGGQTVGKRLMKLRVVRADGRPAGMGEIAVRTILRVIDNYLVGLIVMLATGDRRQRIGDLAAGTIVVDASAVAVAPPAPAVAVAEPVEEIEEVDEPDEQVADEPVATKTITLPARPAPPATLADLTEPEAPEAPAAPEMRPFPPVEEPVVEEPVVEERVAEEPVVEEPAFEEPVVEDEPVAEVPEDVFPEVTSPSLEELAQDVAAAHDEAEEVAVDDDAVEELPEEDGPVTVKSVETVSAIDLVMGGAPEEDSSESSSESAQDAEDSASL